VPQPAKVQQVSIGPGNEPHLSLENFSKDQVPEFKDPSDSLVRPKPRRITDERIYALRPRQRWQGTITQTTKDGFVAVLSDLNHPEHAEEEATFTLDELALPDEELPQVKPGSSFYWVVGTEKSPAGMVKNVSIVQFRRSPTWSRSALSRARATAEQFGSLFTTTD